MTATALRTGVIFAGTALILLIIAADSYEAWQDHREALEHSEKALQSLSRALAEQTARMVQEVDVVLADFADLARSPSGQSANPLVLKELLRSRLMRLPFIQSSTVVGADGLSLASTRDDEPIATNWSQREIFIALQRPDAKGLYIGIPRIGRSSGVSTFALGRAFHDSRGNFAGIVVARVAFDYLSKFYEAVDISPDVSIRLLRDDGVILAHYPDVPAVNNSDADITIVKTQTGSGLVANTRDKDQSRLIARRKVEDYAMSMQAVQPIDSALARWRQQELGSAARTGTLAVLAALLIAALATVLRRRERSEQERLRLEKQLRAAQQAETIGMFAASIAHDFNNVLGAIVGYGELARDALPKGSTALTNIDRLLTASERAHRLVRRILTFDLHRGVRNANLDVEPIVKEVLDQIRATLPGAVSIGTAELNSPAMIQGDATEVHQVVMNLCSNAIRAMPSGGVLALTLNNITIEKDQSPNASKLMVGQLQPGAYVCFSVRDNGIGMTSELIATIFEPFFSTKQVASGSGIGLAVVENIVLKMGGAIAVESQPGVGSTFRVFWPAAIATDANDNTNTDKTATGRGETIMVVDDDATLVAIAEELLATLGYEPVGFSDPELALEALRRNPLRFDAILSDESMPSLRGSDLALAVHAIRSDLPIVLMTGHRDSGLNNRAQRAGVKEVLDKPLRSEQLQSVFGRLLRTTTQ
jgi:signal transduction histidine kinase/ActR/RegA family two-component response regulator